MHQRDARPDGDGRRERVVLRVRMEHRQHDELAVGRTESGRGGHGRAGECVVRLGDHHALRTPRGSTREHDRSAVGGFDRRRSDDRTPCVSARRRQRIECVIVLVDGDRRDVTNIAARCSERIVEDRATSGRHDRHERSCSDEMFGEFVRRGHRIRRHDPRSEADRSEPTGDERRRVGQRQMHAALERRPRGPRSVRPCAPRLGRTRRRSTRRRPRPTTRNGGTTSGPRARTDASHSAAKVAGPVISNAPPFRRPGSRTRRRPEGRGGRDHRVAE